MGILDSVLGNVLGGANRAPNQPIGSGMSPMMKALLLALAAKAYHDYRNRSTQPSGQMPSGPGPDPSGGAGGAGGGGFLGGLGAGGLGGLLAGLGGAGALGSLVDQFRQNGLGNQVNSWVGNGQNQPIAPDQLDQALGSDTIDQLSRQFQMPRNQLLSELSNELPGAIDHMTPNGQVPDDAEMQRRWV
ncbi:MAG: DUF937 domain-containing protein [Methylobacteriaceae bacterium]|nr:DUF937 domain-containing protein [Methylobacteriaceae bacterium]